MINKIILISLLSLLGFTLSSCKTNSPTGEYNTTEVGKVKKVVPGIIISKRPVKLHQDITNSKSNFDNGFNQSHGVEYVIKLNTGGIISVVQAEDLNLKSKQKILVIYGKNTRVVADNGSESF